MDFKIEICVDSIESAITAQEAGADRIELCDNLTEGGTTPSIGTITAVRKNLDIDVNVIIRPRGGDFLYDDSEFDIMRRDIEACGELGINGIVLGLLRKDGKIDIDRTARLIEFANPMTSTFHRAFDMCSDPYTGLEDVISTGAHRLLTSGQNNKAEDGLMLIRYLVKAAGDRIVIMPGSGINISNIKQIAIATTANEFHLTARKTRSSEMQFKKEGILMGGNSGIDEYQRKVADKDMIINIREILKMI